MWFAGLEGTVSTISGAPPVDIDVSPSQAIEDTEASFMLWMDMRKGRQGLFLGFVYTDVESEEVLIPEIDLAMQSISKTTLGNLAYSFNLVSNEQAVLDLMAGARYWDVDTTLSFSGGLGVLAGKTINNSDSWWDPEVGLKGRIMLGNSRFYVGGLASVGGFGVGSDLFWDLAANFGFQWTSWLGTSVGYQYLDVDFEDDGFLYDTTQQGWMVNLTFLF